MFQWNRYRYLIYFDGEGDHLYIEEVLHMSSSSQRAFGQPYALHPLLKRDP